MISVNEFGEREFIFCEHTPKIRLTGNQNPHHHLTIHANVNGKPIRFGEGGERGVTGGHRVTVQPLYNTKRHFQREINNYAKLKV